MGLLFGLGIMGVVLSNLLAGEGGSSSNGTATLPRTGRETTDERQSEGPSQEAPSQEEPPQDEPTEARYEGLGVGIDAPDDRPRVWGHPAPLAKLIALITVSGALLSSAIWGAGWLVARTIARSLAGG